MDILHRRCRIRERAADDGRPRYHLAGEPDWLPALASADFSVGSAIGGLQYGSDDWTDIVVALDCLHRHASAAR